MAKELSRSLRTRPRAAPHAAVEVGVDGEEDQVVLRVGPAQEAPALHVLRHLHAEVLGLHRLGEDRGHDHLVLMLHALAPPVAAPEVKPTGHERHGALVLGPAKDDPRRVDEVVSRRRHGELLKYSPVHSGSNRNCT